jgi:hypothetical protein
MTMTTRDPLLDRLRRLPRTALDDVGAARTLARAEASFAAHAPSAPHPVRRWSAPTALAIWGLLYLCGSVRELQRIFPSQEVRSHVARSWSGAPPLTRSLSGGDDLGRRLVAARQGADGRQPIR